MRVRWLLPTLITISLFTACDSDRKNRRKKDREDKTEETGSREKNRENQFESQVVEKEQFRHYEAEAGFSIVPPQGWEAKKLLSVRAFSGPVVNGVQVNLNVVVEPYDGSVDDYAIQSGRIMENAFPNYVRVSQQDIILDSGRSAKKVVTRNSYVPNGPTLEQIYYLAGGSGKIFVITGTKHVAENRFITGEFEKCARSFREER